VGAERARILLEGWNAMSQWPEHGYVESDEAREYYWRASRLWTLASSMPVEEVSLGSFDWENDNFQCNSLSDPPLWRDIGEHLKRALEADLQYPIVISAEGKVMDGMHRILKCHALGHRTVKAVRFEKNPEPDIVRQK
jgi:hypothetical protein